MLRWRMLRHGAHHVNRPSLSGSSARPTSTRPRPRIRSMQRALLRQLADRARLALLRVDVALGARDVHVAAAARAAPPAACDAGVRVHRLEEPHLGGEVLAAVRHVDRRDGQRRRRVDRDDAVLVVEGGMREGGPLGRERLADVQADAGVALAAVPVAPVALHLAEGGRHLVGGGLDFLQADDVRALALDPFLDLRLTRPDAVDVPGGDLQIRFDLPSLTRRLEACAA